MEEVQEGDLSCPMLESFDALIQAPGVFGIPFYTALGRIPFAGVYINFHGDLCALAVAGNPQIDGCLAVVVTAAFANDRINRKTVFLVHPDQFCVFKNDPVGVSANYDFGFES